MVAFDLKERFFHRDLSWLAFNERVLEEAADLNNPFLERLKFLAIFVSNMDEFHMVRVASLLRSIESGYNRKDNYGYYPQELYEELKSRSRELIRRLYDIYRERVDQEFKPNKISLRKFSDLSKEQQSYVEKYFDTTLYPIITPLAVDQSRPFPVLPSRTIAFAVRVRRDDETHFALIPIPANVPRLVKIPSVRDEHSFILADEIIRENLNVFFRGFEVEEFTLFRLMRDSELSVDEELAPDLLKAIEREVKRRSWASVVYLEVEEKCSSPFLETLCELLKFNKEEVVSIAAEFDLTCLFQMISQVGDPALQYQDFPPAKTEYENIFQRIDEGDFIIHVPYQSFYPTVDLIRSAASDKTVLAIKMTLYRTNEDSGIITALKEAARNKKQVTVLVEIKARFDEERNILWAKELEEAGCHVIYGIAGLKIHSKMTLIVRQEEGRIRRYVHLSTGNYNEKTAKVYTDIGYFTCNDDFARDISDVFNVITGYSRPSPWKRVISAPNDLRKHFLNLVDKEIHSQKKNRNGRIFAKMNSLEDPQIIEKLYEASQAGVKVQLIVRGICCLVPGLPDLSENIEVKSVVGRFLEHTRIFIFHNNASPRIFLSSADWMSRNFDRRVEILFEIYKQEIKDHIQFVMDLYWKDNVKSRFLLADKKYIRPKILGPKINTQNDLILHYGGRDVQ